MSYAYTSYHPYGVTKVLFGRDQERENDEQGSRDLAHHKVILNFLQIFCKNVYLIVNLKNIVSNEDLKG
jgi:hypothetical protein